MTITMNEQISTRYLVYRPGQERPETVLADLPRSMTLEQVEALVRPLVGGSVEHKPTLLNGHEADLFVNQFAYPEGFELNVAATAAHRIAVRGVAVVFERVVYARDHAEPVSVGPRS